MNDPRTRTLLSIFSCIQSLEESTDPGIDKALVAELKHIVLQRMAELKGPQPRASLDNLSYEPE